MTWTRHNPAPAGRMAPGKALPVESETSVAGSVERIIYRSDDSGYTVCALKSKEAQEEIILVGSSAAIWPGETIRAEGSWTRHRQHGLQFNAVKIDCVEPSTVAGIKKYLASGLVRGVSDILAERIVRKFGADTLRVIDQDSARLEAVEGIGRKKRETIRLSWVEQKAVRAIMIFLHAHGVSASQAARIYRAYGEKSIDILRQNPYRLAADIWGIGFKSADRIAMNLGIPVQSLVRARAGIVYTLQTMTEEGHCYSLKDDLLQQSEKQLEIGRPLLDEALAIELSSGALVACSDRIYPPALYEAEAGCAAHLKRIRDSSESAPLRIDAERAIAWAAQRMEIEFSPEQAQALKMAMTSKTGIITGGPGVGKTTIIRALVDVLSAKKLSVRLAAPTGRAAKRMEEATGRAAMTIHRMLKYLPGRNSFEYGPRKSLPGDVFILDEASMIDIVLMHSFLRALPPSARLLVIGDADQLPSVGPGNVLRDMIASGALPSIKLDRIFRQSEKSMIIRNAHLINAGRFFEPEDAGDGSRRDFYFIEEDDPGKIIERVVEMVTRRIPRKFNLSPRSDIQVLTPMRRFQLGADNLNAVLQAAINPRGEEFTRFGRILRTGDRVMQLRNNYNKDVFNGDIGVISSIDAPGQTFTVDFDCGSVLYDFNESDEISLAYASSIHKAQGSEHPAVVILMATQHYKLLQRNLLYTAVTRGRSLVCLIGSKKAVAIAIRNNQTAVRRTALAERLA
ncbi:MAG: ATP-dependent RecD-like DNA helicase [Kiritimatiellia bacterium]